MTVISKSPSKCSDHIKKRKSSHPLWAPRCMVSIEVKILLRGPQLPSFPHRGRLLIGGGVFTVSLACGLTATTAVMLTDGCAGCWTAVAGAGTCTGGCPTAVCWFACWPSPRTKLAIIDAKVASCAIRQVVLLAALLMASCLCGCHARGRHYLPEGRLVGHRAFISIGLLVHVLRQVFGAAVVHIYVRPAAVLHLGLLPGFCDVPLEELQVQVEGLGVAELLGPHCFSSDTTWPLRGPPG